MNQNLLKLVILVPAFNEAERIGSTIKSLFHCIEQIAAIGYSPEIWVVDDGSFDQTSEIAVNSGAHRVIRHKVNQGLGAAVRTGLAAARDSGVQIVVKFDADLQHDPSDICELVRPILDDEADIVYGNRFNKIEYKMPLERKIGNIVFTRLMRFLTKWPLKDSQPGIFAVGRSYLEVFRLPGNYNYTQQILLDGFHKGMRFAHHDVSFRKRETGKSFVTFRYPFKVLPQIFWVVVGVKPMKIFAPVGLMFLIAALGISIIEVSWWLSGESAKPILHVNAVLGLAMFGLQILLFGIIAELIIQNGKK